MKNIFGWGIGLWVFGYILGFIFFAFAPQNLIGFVIMPFGIIATVWVLFKKIKSTDFNHYLKLAIIWTLIAIIFDYLFLVMLLKPVGYYKFDVYLYYFLTFTLPLIVGWYKTKNDNK